MNKTFIINGQGKSGKDTFIDFLQEECHEFEFDSISSVDEIKMMAEQYFNYTGEKTHKERKLISDLKILHTEYSDGPFEYMKTIWKDNKKYDGVISIFHIREPDEIKKMVKLTKAETILIKRFDVEEFGNMADDNVYNYNYDYIIDNYDSLDKLRESAITFVKNCILKKEVPHSEISINP